MTSVRPSCVCSNARNSVSRSSLVFMRQTPGRVAPRPRSFEQCYSGAFSWLGGRALAQVVEQLGKFGSRQGDARIGASVVNTDRAGGLVENPAAGKHHAVDVSLSLVRHLGGEDPFVAAAQDAAR